MIEYKKGDLVLLTLASPGTVGITTGLMKFKDRKFRISRVRTVRHHVYYELNGCVSGEGIPYAVTADWIQLMTETDNGCVYGRRK